jgi:hypothetical protein
MERMTETEQRAVVMTTASPLVWTRVGDWEVRSKNGAQIPVGLDENGKLGLPCECCVKVRRAEAWRDDAR